jgi:PTS system nitrogen regulatory IIA component
MLPGSMRLSELFPVEDVLLHFAPTDKWDAIRRLVEHLVRRGRLPASAQSAIVESVLARERSTSTGMEHGIAIPHAAVEGVERVVACLGVIDGESGLEFQSCDGRPARFVVLLVIPRAQKLLHIRTLADIARVLLRDSVRSQLLAAQTPAEAWAALADEGSAKR